MQSARMASEIHKRRTGKGFRITEEIVMKEEMYEEEDDDLPRHYRALAADLQANPDLHNRVSAYVSTNVAMRTWQYQNEIDERFAREFPHVGRMRPSMYSVPLQQSAAGQVLPQQQQQLDFSIASPSRSHSIPTHSSGVPLHPSVDSAVSPPELSNGSDTSQTPVAMTREASFVVPITSGLAPMPLLATDSPFTAELPNEVKQLANMHLADWMAPIFHGESGELMAAALAYDETCGEGLEAIDDCYFQQPLSTASRPSSQQYNLSGQMSTIGTPGGGAGDAWDAWINPQSLNG